MGSETTELINAEVRVKVECGGDGGGGSHWMTKREFFGFELESVNETLTHTFMLAASIA